MPDRNSLHRFYTESRLAKGTRISLDEHVSKQIRRVLRLRTDDRVMLFDGHGLEATARIVSSGRDEATVEVETDPESGLVAPPPSVHLGLALLKSDKFELVIQKATELGVTSITPLESERSVVSLPADRARSRLERWRRIVREALEQSGRADRVEILEPVSFVDALSAIDGDRQVIAWEQESKRALADAVDGRESTVAILIGPEGGFTEQEVSSARSAGFEPVSLGSLILRSETAAIASVSIVRTASDLHRRSMT